MNVQAISEKRQIAVRKQGLPNFALSFGVAFVVIGLIVAGLFLSILKINHGTFTYTLDDPYIHLTLSNQILHGNYGINAGQHAAPSSSILFPFLLVAAAGTALHPYLPLILNVAALFLTVEIMRRLFVHLELAQDKTGGVVMAGAIVMLAVCLNIIGVVFTGLEHSLHIATVAAIIYGLAVFLDEQTMPGWLPTVIVLCPLLRYEGLPLSFAAILILAVRGRWRTAAITLAAIVVLVGGFSVFLMGLGLRPLPSSVLVKSVVAADGVGGGSGLVVSVIRNAAAMYATKAGLLLLIAGVAAAARCLLESPARPKNWSSHGLMSVALVFMVAGHAVAGRFGWFNRYEVYILVGATLIGIYLFQRPICKALAHTGDRRLVIVIAAASCLSLATARYIEMTMLVPFGANNIFDQQLQMHRFVDDFYRRPAAVNDLGLVSYRNPNFVLDLDGLASERARVLNSGKPNPAAYDALLKSNGVHLAILYEDVFRGRIPGSWEKVGSLELARPEISEKDVQFYVTDPATSAQVRDELVRFQKGLPSGVKLILY